MPADDPEQLIRDGHRLGPVGAVQKDSEDVSADPREYIGPAQPGADQLGEDGEHLIARGHAE